MTRSFNWLLPAFVLREQYSGAAGEDTDSNLEAEKTQARIEGLIGNPD